MTSCLITGPRPALEHALASEVYARQAQGPLAPVHFLVGGTLLRPYLRRLLVDRLGGVFNVQILTPGELGLLLGEPRLIARGDKPLPFLAERVLAAQAATHQPGAFGPVAALPGFPGALTATLRDLRFSHVSPSDLEDAASAEHDPDDPDTRRLASLAALHAYVQSGRAGRYGAEEALALVDPAGLQGNGLIVYGIWDTSALLRDALVRITADGQPVTIFTPETATTADDALENLWHFATTRLAAERVRLDDRNDRPPTNLGTAQRNLFSRSAAPANPADATLALLSAPDPVREAREIVRRLLAWADDGIPFHEMAVVYRDASYRPLLDAALRDADVPAYVHEGTPLAERPLGRRVHALLTLADARHPDTGEPRLDRADVAAFLGDARLPEDTYAAYGRSSVPRWEQISRQAGVTGGNAADWQQRLNAYADDLVNRRKPDEEIPDWVIERQTSARHLADFVTDLGVALAVQPKTATWSVHVAWLDSLLERYVGDSVPVRGALADLARLDDLAGEVDAHGFSSAVTAVLEGLRDRDVLGSRQGAFGSRGVAVLDANSMRGLGFRAVAVVGVAERSFPPPPREDPLLLDDRRAALNAAHGFQLPLRARGSDPEPLQFHSVVAAASERLLASYARAGADGRAQLPSIFFRALAEQLAGTRITVEEIEEGGVPHLTRLAANRIGPHDAQSAVTAQERRRALLEDRHPHAVALVRHRLRRTGLGALARDARRVNRLTPYDGVLSTTGLAALMQLSRFDRLSATGLEDYAGCPHRQLLNGILGLREIEEPEDLLRVSAPDKGSAVHDILERFLREQPLGQLGLRAEKTRLRAVATTVLDALEASGRTGYALLWDVDRIRIVEDLERWLETSFADLQNRPTHRGYEVSFGDVKRDGTEPDPMSSPEPLDLTLSGNRCLSLRGFVDRVDHDPDTGRFEVVDYKTGSMWGKESNALRGGRTLQLPLYVMAIAQALGADPAKGRGRYESVDRKGGFGQVVYDASVIAGEPSPLIGVLDALIAAREAGDFHREPSKSECNYCKVKNACEPCRRLLRDRKSEDPHIVAHTEREERFP